MTLKGLKSSQSLDLVAISIIAIIYAQLSISAHFMDAIYEFAAKYGSSGAVEFLANFIFLLLAGLLWVTYQRWRKTQATQRDLESVIESIIPDAILVLAPDRSIVACNSAVKKMFGYDRAEVMGRNADYIFTEHQSRVGVLSEAYAVMEEDAGFHMCLATGKHKNGDTLSLEVVTGALKSNLGSVVLLHTISST
jgi:PAS domain S-box-containing protein